MMMHDLSTSSPSGFWYNHTAQPQGTFKKD